MFSESAIFEGDMAKNIEKGIIKGTSFDCLNGCGGLILGLVPSTQLRGPPELFEAILLFHQNH